LLPAARLDEKALAMLKTIQRNNIQTTPFVATKGWQLGNTQNDVLLLISQTGSLGQQLALSVGTIDYGDGTLPHTSSVGSLALAQQNNDEVIYQEGISGSGLFYPNEELTNADGTYKRLVHSTLRNMFYNDYKDPTKLWGLENIDLHKGGTKRFLSDKVRSFMIPRSKFGEKVVEESVTLVDNSLDNDYTIADDGLGNLYASTNLFSRVQEIGEFGNYISGGYAGDCEFYVSPFPPTPATTLTGYWSGAFSTNGDVVLTWTDNSDSELGFNIYRASGSGVYSQIGSVVADVITYSDHTATTSSNFSYYVEAFNSYGGATGSNIFSINTPNPSDNPWQNMTSSFWEAWSGSFWEDLT
jgi:hypothetical protein